MFWADQIGLDNILGTVEQFYDDLGGDQWKPAGLLQELVSEGRKFSDL